MMNKYSLCFLIMLLVTLKLNAQKPDISFQYISIEEGLPSPLTSRLIEDQKGHIWIGSFADGGLMRYDGSSFTQFKHDPNKENSLAGNQVLTIIQDQSGMIWVRTNSPFALHKIDPFTEAIKRIDLSQLEKKLPDGKDNKVIVRNFCSDQADRIWMVGNFGLAAYNPEKESINQIEIDVKEKGFTDNLIIDLIKGKKEELWLASLTGLSCFDLTDSTINHYPYDFSKGRNLNLMQDRTGNIWIGSWGDGLICFDTKKKRFTKHYRHDPKDPNSLSHSGVFGMLEDSKGNFWIGTDGGGLNLFDRNKETFYHYMPDKEVHDAIHGRNILDLIEDQYGNIWIASGDHGLNIIPNQNQIQFFPSFNGKGDGLNGFVISEMYETKDGKIWFGIDYESGLHLFDPQTSSFQVFKYDPLLPNGLPGNKIGEVYEDSNGLLWVTVLKYNRSPGGNQWVIGTFKPEINQFTEIPPDKLGLQNLLNWGDVEFFEDSKGRLWLSRWNQLRGVRISDLRTDRFVPLEKYARGMSEDRNGNIFALSSNYNKNIQRINLETLKQETYLEDVEGLSLLVDQADQLWVTGNYELLCIDLQTDSIQRFGKEDGLSDGGLGGILEDDHGNIWVRTTDGLYKINGRNKALELISRKYPYTNTWLGMGSVLKTKSGHFLFGGYNGFIYFHPDSIQAESRSLKTLITDFSFSEKYEERSLGSEKINKSLKGAAYLEQVELEYAQRDFSITFSALEFLEPERVLYRFQLENYDPNWRQTDASLRVANYTNLSPGTYTFQVQASLDGNWPESATSIQIRIFPPWWLTWWAYALYALLLLGAGYGLFYWRTTLLRRQRQLLRTRVFEQTQEIREEQARSDGLLLNILPAAVAQELKAKGKTQPVFFEEVTILFADFKGYTNIVASIPGKQLVTELDDIFQHYDDIIVEEGLEKIQTVGDAYLAACGLPHADSQHAQKCIAAGKRIIQYLETRNKTSSVKWQVRLGIHSGPITAGVIGKRKFSYDLFGDTINIAARMESAGEAGKINISAASHHLVKEEVACTYRGKIDAKGKGELDMYFVD